jgi:hypothetical protein
MEGGKRNHLSYTSSPGEMPNHQSKYRLAYNYRTLTDMNVDALMVPEMMPLLQKTKNLIA